jgi:hypothetical protein
LLVDVPDCVASLLELAELYINNNQLCSLSPAVTGRLTSLTHLALSNNMLTHLPREIGLLRALVVLDVRLSSAVSLVPLTHAPQQVFNNKLISVPVELGNLSRLRDLYLQKNQLQWLPIELDRLPAELRLLLVGNPLALLPATTTTNATRAQLPEIFAATTHIGMICERAMMICVALQDLDLPAFVTLKIVDEAVHENSVRMWAKWELITAVKHFRDRRNSLASGESA